ncbi:MAG: lipoyl(octanoyl) transferase LipB [Hyphomonadaceae bacterium]
MTDWAVSSNLVDYPAAVAVMEDRAARIREGSANELVWLLEHPPLYTRGASARPDDLKDPERFPVFDSARGGQFTYHGPGQRVAYVMLDLATRGRDVRDFVCNLEGWIIDTLADFNIKGERRSGRVGVWVDRTRPEERSAGMVREDKIAAIGVRLRKWVSFHGISLNVDPDLDHFEGITPCGISQDGLGVTSLEALGQLVSLPEVDVALKRNFEKRFGPVSGVEPPTV